MYQAKGYQAQYRSKVGIGADRSHNIYSISHHQLRIAGAAAGKLCLKLDLGLHRNTACSNNCSSSTYQHSSAVAMLLHQLASTELAASQLS
jgi:hypothetical protein